MSNLPNHGSLLHKYTLYVYTYTFIHTHIGICYTAHNIGLYELSLLLKCLASPATLLVVVLVSTIFHFVLQKCEHLVVTRVDIKFHLVHDVFFFMKCFSFYVFYRRIKLHHLLQHCTEYIVILKTQSV